MLLVAIVRFAGLAAVALTAFAFPRFAAAREMQGRVGLGYNSEFQNSTTTQRVPAVSLKYGLTRDIAVEGLFGIASTSPANTIIGAKFFKNLLYETNLNYYFMLGGGILSASGNSGGQFLGGFGVEFFVPGLESLGFSFEVGASIDTLSGMTVRTLGASFLDAGMHFYF